LDYLGRVSGLRRIEALQAARRARELDSLAGRLDARGLADSAGQLRELAAQDLALAKAMNC
jgi:hypothetical protein